MAAIIQDVQGAFNGGSFCIQHRDTNTILILDLNSKDEKAISAKPGTMISITPGIQIDGRFHFSFKSIFSGDQIAYLYVGGTGQAIMSNHGLGDIVPLRVAPGVAPWRANRNAFMLMTHGITRSSKAQSMGKAFLSGSGLWVHTYEGDGVLFVETFGALLQKDLAPGETFLVHHHYAVAWNCGYEVETIKTKGGGFFSKLATGDFWMCKFIGPGRIYFSSKSAQEFGEWISGYIPQKQG